jgi:D-alanyl-D-alanine carboxypeptidase
VADVHEVRSGRRLDLADDLEVATTAHRTRLRLGAGVGLLVLALPGLLALAVGRSRPAAAASSPAAPVERTAAARRPLPPDSPAPAVEPTASSDPLSVAVLVNRTHPLPAGWVPPDLVEPDVPFDFAGHDPKRLMRREAAGALGSLFSAARADGLPLVGVSAYRSETRQRDLFAQYRRRDGAATAETYSAPPGTSEHQTGLAIDVTGADGRCPASECFGLRPEAAWLAAHAAAYGFVVRYPAGKELVTGYRSEPWHLRYVGTELARSLAATGRVLEEAAAR